MPLSISFLLPSSQFLLGQMVDGKLSVKAKHDVMVTAITVAYVCVERIHSDGSQRRLCQHTVVLKSSKTGFIVHEREEFPFHISIPIDLPPTMNNEYLSIEHRFVAKLIKPRTSTLLWQKKTEHKHVVEMLYPHLNGLSYYTKRYEFTAGKYLLVLNLERNIYSIGQKIRARILLDGPAEKDVQLPLMLSLVRTYSNKKNGEIHVVSFADALNV